MERHTLRVTTGVIVERDGKILVVREPLPALEPTRKTLFITHPSGHMEARESVLQSVIRECLEETGYAVELTDLIGVYETTHTSADYLRFSFLAKLTSPDPVTNISDADIVERLWMPIDELQARRNEWRPGATTRTFDDYFAGKRFPLSLIGQIGKIDIA